MKLRKNLMPVLLLTAVLSTLSSCQLVADIFKGGMYFGIILVLVVIVFIIWLLRKMSK